ncbi:hypothetical protein ABW21_db0206710 [Orbilia brochopaga]|nr:hypothetical protein ABW21_db0206710 [Drechslerella brochopaga]
MCAGTSLILRDLRAHKDDFKKTPLSKIPPPDGRLAWTPQYFDRMVGKCEQCDCVADVLHNTRMVTALGTECSDRDIVFICESWMECICVARKQEDPEGGGKEREGERDPEGDNDDHDHDWRKMYPKKSRIHKLGSKIANIFRSNNGYQPQGYYPNVLNMVEALPAMYNVEGTPEPYYLEGPRSVDSWSSKVGFTIATLPLLGLSIYADLKSRPTKFSKRSISHVAKRSEPEIIAPHDSGTISTDTKGITLEPADLERYGPILDAHYIEIHMALKLVPLEVRRVYQYLLSKTDFSARDPQVHCQLDSRTSRLSMKAHHLFMDMMEECKTCLDFLNGDTGTRDPDSLWSDCTDGQKLHICTSLFEFTYENVIQYTIKTEPVHCAIRASNPALSIAAAHDASKCHHDDNTYAVSQREKLEQAAKSLTKRDEMVIEDPAPQFGVFDRPMAQRFVICASQREAIYGMDPDPLNYRTFPARHKLTGFSERPSRWPYEGNVARMDGPNGPSEIFRRLRRECSQCSCDENGNMFPNPASAVGDQPGCSDPWKPSQCQEWLDCVCWDGTGPRRDPGYGREGKFIGKDPKLRRAFKRGVRGLLNGFARAWNSIANGENDWTSAAFGQASGGGRYHAVRPAGGFGDPAQPYALEGPGDPAMDWLDTGLDVAIGTFDIAVGSLQVIDGVRQIWDGYQRIRGAIHKRSEETEPLGMETRPVTGLDQLLASPDTCPVVKEDPAPVEPAKDIDAHSTPKEPEYPVS